MRKMPKKLTGLKLKKQLAKCEADEKRGREILGFASACFKDAKKRAKSKGFTRKDALTGIAFAKMYISGPDFNAKK